MKLADLEFNIPVEEVLAIINGCKAKSVVLLDMVWDKYKNMI